MGFGIPRAEGTMICVICKSGEVRPATVQAEIRAGLDRLIVSVEGEVCPECGEAYYPTETMRYLERVRDDFIHKTLTPASVGTVYQVS
jgi:YgiT-type zinc finger domain-containing protein